jgi:pyruvyl transferase EpsI
MFYKIKKMLSIDFKIKLRLFLLQFKKNKDFVIKKNRTNSKRVYIFLAADYGNLGDVAITYAQHKFLQHNFPDYIITEIPISKTIAGISTVKKIINPYDIVTIVGGGNLGNLYPIIESFRQSVINNFKNNKIISFPQTIDFTNSLAGKKSLKKAIKIYGRHTDLTLLAREQKTYDFFKTNFTNNQSFLVPDIVLALSKSKPTSTRSGVIICLRNDKEKKLTSNQEKKLLQIIDADFNQKTVRDTHIGGENLSLFFRTKELHKIWSDFRNSELVITDRLHGMIFSYITNTPALVFLNNNHKIKSSFHWIKNDNKIKLVENFSEKKIKESIAFLKREENDGEKLNLTPIYRDFIKFIKKTS